MRDAAQPSDAERALELAHRKLLASKDLQFDFVTYKVPEPPNWLIKFFEAIGEFFKTIAPVLKYVFWGGLAVCVALIAWVIVRDLIRIRAQKLARPLNLRGDEQGWRPSVEGAKALLGDADALAAEGRYAEAAHLLLLRGVNDFAAKRPGVLRPAYTSRDLASLEAMPAPARTAFALIADVVERSLFGGRPVDADHFAICRQAYADFALPERWA